ncbi:MAG: replication initiation protein [Lachnospiraceae bacterium]|nr:replication initiation protein [Lachnospiraceae bacterium]
MNSDERIEISKKREYLVVKGNELIQKNRFELSLQEQKTVAFICSMIKPVDAVDKANGVPYQLEYEFNIRDYCKVCGIDYDNGKNYADVKAVLKHLRDRSMWLTLEDGSETLVGWLAKVTTNKRSGIAKIKLDEDLVPYLFDLGQKFTQYQLYNILAMKSAFSVRIYELLKSYAFQKSKTFDIDELKRLLSIDGLITYKNFNNFRTKILERVQTEINEVTDLNISFEPVTKGRKVVKVKFRIEQKNPIERMLAGATAQDRLESINKS